jgi:solute carrier family 25 folate transporter 32
MPLDIAKTRLQTMKPQADGAMPYKCVASWCFAVRAGFAAASCRRGRGLLDALVKIGRNEGVLAYWKGFAPYFLRLGNHTAFTFLFLEELKKLW